MRRRWTTGAMLLCGTAAGCVPATFTTLPGIRGQVVDGATGRPVAAARVALYVDGWTGSGRAESATPAAVGRSAADGRVDLPPQTEWGLLFAGMDFVQRPDRVVVTADGYEPWTVRGAFSGGPSLNRYDSLGRLPLRAAGRGPDGRPTGEAP